MRDLSLQTVKHTSLMIAFAIVLLTACNREAELTPQATQTSLPPPLNVTYCDIDPADICLDGFGLDSEERLIILFNVLDKLYADIYIRASGPDGEILFECQPSENNPDHIYCLGESFPEEAVIKLNIYSKSSNKFIAIGVFNVQFSDLPETTIDFGANTTATPSPVGGATATSSPEPSYPNPSYPNPSYPNPTLVP